MPVPAEPVHKLARNQDPFGIIFGEILGKRVRCDVKRGTALDWNLL